MNNHIKISPLILVMEAVEEIRDGIEKLLKVEGYRVEPARDIADAVLKAKRQTPTLILISLGGSADEGRRTTNRLRQQAGLSETVPVVIFCSEEVPQGEEVDIGGNIYLTRLDNFDQLRAFLHRLLGYLPVAS